MTSTVEIPADQALRAKGRQPDQGACECRLPDGTPALYPDCRCEWATLIQDLIAFAYRSTPIERLTGVEDRQLRMLTLIRHGRMTAIARLVEQLGSRRYGGLSAIARQAGISPASVSVLYGQAREAGLTP